MLLHEHFDDRRYLVQTTLLTAQREHLHAEDAFRALQLQPLAQGQSFEGQLFGVGKPSSQARTHRA